MSYVQKIEHIVEMTKEEFIDMLESRYNAKSPLDPGKLKITYFGEYNEQGGVVHGNIKIIWHTEETINTDEPE